MTQSNETESGHDRPSDSSRRRGPKPGAGIAAGMAIGVGVGVALGNLPLGIGLAVVLAAGIESSRKR